METARRSSGGEITEAGGCNAGAAPAASSRQVAVEMQEQTPSQTFGNVAILNRGCCGGFTARVTQVLFISHLFAFTALVIYLGILASSHQNPTYKPFANFIPLVSSIIVSTIAACFWLVLAVTSPPKAIKISLWAAPILVLACGAVILSVGNGVALGLGILTVVVAIAEALYGCWAAGPHLWHGIAVLAASVNGARVPFAASCHLFLVLLAAFGYMSFWTVAISCIAAAEGHFMRFQLAYVAALLLSMAWTMQVLRYLVYVPVAKLAHARLVYGVQLPGGVAEALRGAVMSPTFGDICAGAAAVPVVAAVRGLGRAMGRTSCKEEFIFLFGTCILAASEKMMTQVNPWGFVHVGARGKVFCVASRDVWSLFVLRGMVELVDSELTGSFYFLSAVAGGTLASVVAGSWALVMDKDHKELALPLIIYAFLIGYYMCRMMIAWPQACVATYHVAYAENPQNPDLGTLIPEHLRRLQSLNAD